MDPTVLLTRTAKGVEQAQHKVRQLPSGLNLILEMTVMNATLQQIIDRLPKVEPLRVRRAVEFLVQEGLLTPVVAVSQAPRANYLAPPVIEVEELDAETGVFAWAEAKRGAKMLAEKGFYAQSTLAQAPAHAPNVLLVEDDEQMAEWVRVLLSDEGMQVERVTDAEQAIAVLDAGRVPDMVLLDVMLPGIDGFALLEYIRANPDYGDMPVVMVTGRASDEDVMRGLRAGADGYIIKPFKPPMLVSSVKKMLGMQSIRGDRIPPSHSEVA